jgi:hypothetical protein
MSTESKEERAKREKEEAERKAQEEADRKARDELEKKLAGRKTIEEWARLENTPSWAFAAAKAKANWPNGAQVLLEDFKNAVSAAIGEEVR